MILLGSYSSPPKLWLAAAAPQTSDSPEDEGNELNVRMRLLRVLIVEDEFFISLDIKQLLEALGHVVVAIAVSADEAVKIAEKEHPDVVLMDIRALSARAMGSMLPRRYAGASGSAVYS